jgi:hypothetical protein
MKVTLSNLKRVISGILAEADLSRRQIQLSSEAGEDRYEVFLEKVMDGSPFQLRRGEELIDVRISRTNGNSELLRALRAEDPDAYLAAFSECNGGRGVQATTDDGQTVYIDNPNELVKTEEFGGKGDGYFLEREHEQEEAIRIALEQHGPCRLTVRGNSGREASFEDVATVQKLNNNGKADLELLNSLGKPVGYVSLKWSEEPVQMHQWGGIHRLLDDAEVKDFVSSLRRRSHAKLRDNSFTRSVRSTDIKLDAVFGCEHDEEGMDCTELEVDAVVAGKDMLVEPDGEGGLLLTAGNVWLKGEIPDGEWEPTFWTVHNKSDKQRGASYGLPGTRIMVGPSDWRKNNVENI